MPKHCFHPNQEANNPYTQKVCCWCNARVNYRRLKTEEHGPFASWLYNPVPIETDILNGDCDGSTK